MTSPPPGPIPPVDLSARGLPFVVLWHETPSGAKEGPHFDLLITPPQPFEGGDAGRLWAARVPFDPSEWFLKKEFNIVPLAPHRAEYLTYEGPLSADRGHVKRVCAGRAFASEWTDERKRLTLEWPGQFIQVDLETPIGGVAVARVLRVAMEFTFLGCGTSTGVPLIGCDCPVCRSADERNRRLRASVLVRHPDERGAMRVSLVDTSPDLRQQTLRDAARLNRLDTVFYTHAHADHIFGLDDLRRFNAVMEGRALEFFAEQSVIETLRRMFAYVFDPHKNVNPSYVAQLIPFEAKPGDPITLGGACWTPIRLLHGRLPILGWRVDCGGKALAYCTDVSAIPPESWELLSGLDVLVMGALRERHHPTHFSISQALHAIEQAAPRQAYLTHMGHEIEYAQCAAALPCDVAPAFDGLRLVL